MVKTIYVYYFNQRNNPDRAKKTYTHIKQYYDQYFGESGVSITNVNDCDPEKVMGDNDYFYVHMCSNRMNMKNIIRFANRIKYENRTIYLYDSFLNKQHKWEVELFQYFSKVLTNYSPICDNLKYFWCPPFSRVHNKEEIPKSKLTKFCAMMPFDTCDNKHRVSLAIELGKRFHVHIYGKNQYFDKIPAGNCKGEIKTIDDLRKYKFIISMEPVSQECFVSEYLSDCLLLNNVAVYYGPKTITKYFPKLFDDGFINGYDFATPYELIQFMRNMSDKEYLKRIENIKKHRDKVLETLSLKGVFSFAFGKILNVKRDTEIGKINERIVEKNRLTIQIIYSKTNVDNNSYLQQLSIVLNKRYAIIDHCDYVRDDTDFVLTNNLNMVTEKESAFILFNPEDIAKIEDHFDNFEHIIPVNGYLKNRLFKYYDNNEESLLILNNKTHSLCEYINIPEIVYQKNTVKKTEKQDLWSKDIKNYGILLINNDLGKILACKLKEYNCIVVDESELHKYYGDSRIFIDTSKDDYLGKHVLECIDNRCLPIVSPYCPAYYQLHVSFSSDNYYDFDQWIAKIMDLLTNCLTSNFVPIINPEWSVIKLMILLNMHRHNYNPLKNR